MEETIKRVRRVLGVVTPKVALYDEAIKPK